MSADNVCTILEHAVRFDRKELVKRCTEIVNSDAKAVFQSDSFLSVSHKVLELIVEQASTTTPLNMYEACKKWAKGRVEQQEGDVSGEQIRNLLGEIPSKIEFCEMAYDDFVRYVVKDRILSDSEVVNNLLAKDKMRKIHIRRSGTVGGSWTHGGLQDGISFSVSTNVWLTAVDLFLPLKTGDTLTGTFEVYEDQTQVLTTNVTLVGQADKQFQMFKLPTRVRLQAGKVYSLRQTMKGASGFRGDNCSTNICVDDVNVMFMDLAVGSSDNCTNSSSGHFHGLTLISD